MSPQIILPSSGRSVRADALLAAKNGIDGVYSGDPKQDPAARRYSTISYDKVITDDLR